MYRILVFFACVSAIFGQRRPELNIIREWRQMDFNFPSSSERANAISKGLFIPSNVVPIDVDVDYQGGLGDFVRFIIFHVNYISLF